MFIPYKIINLSFVKYTFQKSYNKVKNSTY